MRVAQMCPICKGSTVLPGNFYGDQAPSSSANVKCRACVNGLVYVDQPEADSVVLHHVERDTPQVAAPEPPLPSEAPSLPPAGTGVVQWTDPSDGQTYRLEYLNFELIDIRPAVMDASMLNLPQNDPTFQRLQTERGRMPTEDRL